jgi:hypothetical protein
MDYIRPSEVAESFIAGGVAKSQLPVRQLLLRGLLSGALLGFATTVAFTANAQGLAPVIGAALFPVGFAMIVVLSLELVTGSFAMVPAAFLAGRVRLPRVLTNLTWVFLGNLIGGCLYAWMYAGRANAVSSCSGHRRCSVDCCRRAGEDSGLQQAGCDRTWIVFSERRALQLDGLHGCGDGAYLAIDAGQNNCLLATHLHLFRIGI